MTGRCACDARGREREERGSDTHGEYFGAERSPPCHARETANTMHSRSPATFNFRFAFEANLRLGPVVQVSAHTRRAFFTTLSLSPSLSLSPNPSLARTCFISFMLASMLLDRL